MVRLESWFNGDDDCARTVGVLPPANKETGTVQGRPCSLWNLSLATTCRASAEVHSAAVGDSHLSLSSHGVSS